MSPMITRRDGYAIVKIRQDPLQPRFVFYNYSRLRIYNFDRGGVEDHYVWEIRDLGRLFRLKVNDMYRRETNRPLRESEKFELNIVTGARW